MTSLLRAIVDRFKNLFVTQAALDLEAEIIAHRAENQAVLLRRAEQYEREGLGGIALFIRKKADALDPDRPLSSVAPALAHWQAETHATLALEEPIGDEPTPEPPSAPASKKRSR